MSFVADVAAYGALLWSLGIFVVQGIGITNLFRFYSSRPRLAVAPTLPLDQVPHITIIRPVKGLEPKLYECIVSTFQQAYPPEKLSIRLCVSEKGDPAYPILLKAVRDFPGFDAEVLVEEEDPLLHGADGHVSNLGPNPKIRNISRAYREAKGDIIWIIDCNVWVGRGVAGRMVDKLLGFGPQGSGRKPFKFVHQLPLLTDLTDLGPRPALPNGRSPSSGAHSRAAESRSCLRRLLDLSGGRLDEMFMATTHAKFYSAINIVGVAPCIVGKSNMFRKSHLDRLTDPAQNPALVKRRDLPVGIGHFSWNICEDHLIGDLLWRSDMPGYGNHGLVLGDLAVQPMEDMSVRAYFARRARWLRARKWTVVVATMVEPGVESLLCNLYFAYGATTVPWLHEHLGVPQTWAAMALIWLAGVMVWMTADWFTYCRLHAGRSVEADEVTPAFARGTEHDGGPARRSFGEWLPAWVAREVLALPIWTWAVLLGTTVSWRGRTFHVRTDMTVYEVGGTAKPGMDKAVGKRE